MSRDFVVIVTQPDRAKEWLNAIGSISVCVQSPVPVNARLPGFDDPQSVYLLDLDTLSPNQQRGLIEHLARKFRIPLEDVRAGIAEQGVPILAQDCFVSVTNPTRWF